MMERIAVILTVFNRKDKTLSCLDSLLETYLLSKVSIKIKIFLTDDGCTDGTTEAILNKNYNVPIQILKGDGSLFWNGGMIKSWKAAIDEGGFDGYLWLNDDTKILPSFWAELQETDKYSVTKVGKRGIYVGSTCDPETKEFTYGGFNFINKWTLKDRFIVPNGKDIVACECAHGNITYVSKEVVDVMGVFCDKYIHGGGDHDYTYLAYKHGFPIYVMKSYVGECENDHHDKSSKYSSMSLKQRIAYLNSPFGFNLNNTLLFNKRCFPYRVPFVWIMGYLKALFPDFSRRIYLFLRKK